MIETITKNIDLLLNNINYLIISILIIGFIITNFYLKRKIKKIKESIKKKYSEEVMNEIENINFLDQDIYIEYYKIKNILNIVRFTFLFSVIIGLILFKTPGIFSFLAIAVGAIIIIFKELLLSFFSFFYISTHYKIGEDIIVGDNLRGEIIYINILNVGLIGKSDNGEHNGQFYTIPNFKLVIENIKKEEVNINKFRKEELEIYFNRELFNISFEIFIEKLTNFLDEELTKKNINNVGNYKTFIGFKYKLRFKYEKEYLIIKISFIEIPRKLSELQSKIIHFVEKNKK